MNMEVLSATDQKKEAFLNGMTSACESPLSAHFPQLREAALNTLNELEIPTTRNENWKYTRVTRITGKTWKTGNPINQSSDFEIAGVDGWKIVFINGVFDAEKVNSLPSMALR